MTAHPGTTPQAARGVSHPHPPMTQCDLCGWPMPVPQHSLRQGQIIGLLTCSECIEDALATRQQENMP